MDEEGKAVQYYLMISALGRKGWRFRDAMAAVDDKMTTVAKWMGGTKAVILLARKPKHKYTNDRCEGFVFSRVFFRVFDLCGFVLFGPKSAKARIFHTK